MSYINSDNSTQDVVIIGAGPVGIFSIFAFGMQGLKCTVIDALDKLGGQCAALYPQKMIYDIPAHLALTGKQLVDNLVDQAMPFAPQIHLNSVVDDITTCYDEHGHYFKLAIKKHDQISYVSTRSVVIALGAGVFKPLRLEMEELNAFENKNVFYFVDDVQRFANKDIAIVGGGDSAVDWALDLAPIAKSIYLVHRREYIKAHAASWQKILDNPKIQVKIPYQLSKVESVEGEFKGVHIANEASSEFLAVDYLLPCFGLKSDIGFLNAWDLDVSHNRIMVDPTTMRTSKLGIYAIGDCAHYNNKRKLILIGFSEAANCATDLFRYIYPDRAAPVGHSTSIGVPGRF